jgi:hypothetical protein
MSSDLKRDPAWFFEANQRVQAIEALGRYFTAFTGSWFDRIADHAHPDQITARDLVAVSMLGVDVPAGTSIWLLNEGTERVRELLSRCPADQHLWDDDIDLTRDGPLWSLWSLLRTKGWKANVGGMGRTKTSKLLEAKRPHSVPIYDSFVASALFDGEPTNYWDTWHERLTGPSGDQLRALVIPRRP